MTSRCTNLRTVSMISPRTASSIALGPGAGHAGHAGPVFLMAITIPFNRVDAESEFGEECFHHDPGPHAFRARVCSRPFSDHPALLAGDDVWTYAELLRASNTAARHLAVRGVDPGYAWPS